MIGGTFIDREPELARFQLEFATTTATRNRIIFLAAPSGFGKSEFTERLIGEQHSAIGLKVRVPANAGGDAPFIRALAIEVNRVAERDGVIMSGDGFLRGVPSSRLRKMHDSALLRDAGTAATGRGIANVVVRLGDRLSNTGEYDFFRSLSDTSRDSTIKIFEYLRYVFAQHRFCVAIENVQAIDNSSESMLDQVLATQRGHFVVLEYTLDAVPARDLDALRRVLGQRGSEVKAVILDRLPLQEIIQRSAYRLDSGIQMELWANFDGNLRKLKDLVLIGMRSTEFVGVESAKEISFLDATRQLVLSLRPAAQFVLALVVAHRSNASHDSLLQLSLESRYFRDTHVGIQDALAELASNELIQTSRARVSIAHDSIAAEVASGFSKYIELANRAWAEHYRRKLDREDFGEQSMDQVLDFLFAFYVKTDPPRLQPLLGEVRRIALSSLSTRRAESILQSIEDSLREQTPEETYEQALLWELLETYYTAGLYPRALATLVHIRTQPLRRTVFHAAILDRLDRHSEAIQFVARTLETRARRHDSFELSLKLIEMISYRSINNYEACHAIHRQIEKIREYAELPEYGYFLRNSEIVLPILESVPLLERSIQIFRTHGRAAAEAQSRISLGMQLVRLGRLDDAEREFVAAEALLRDRRIEWHIVHNDRAVLNLYRPEPDYDGIDELLVAAYLTASIPFDRIAIENNRLAAHALTGDFNFCDALAEELSQKAPEQTDDVLLCITYYNISVYYEMRGNRAAAGQFRSLAREVGNDWPAYWAYRFDGTPITSDPAAEYLARYPFDLVLLSAWHIEISDFGEHS